MEFVIIYSHHMKISQTGIMLFSWKLILMKGYKFIITQYFIL